MMGSGFQRCSGNFAQGSRKLRASFAQAKGLLPIICPTETCSNMIVDSPYLLLYAGRSQRCSFLSVQTEVEKPQAKPRSPEAEKPRKKPMSGEYEKQRCPRPKSASRLHRASKSSPNLRNLSSRKLAQAQFEKLSSHCGRARMAQGFRARMNNFHSILIVVLNTAQVLFGPFPNGWFYGIILPTLSSIITYRYHKP